MGRALKTVRGVAFAVLGVAMAGSWILPRIWMLSQAKRTDPEVVRAVAPLAILAFCVGNLVVSFGDNAVAFLPAEVDFLFPGPFSRRQLLGYKIIRTIPGTLITALAFTLGLRRYSDSWISCAVGAWLTILFMQFFTMAVMMIGQTLGERVYSAGRRWLLLGLLVLLAIEASPSVAMGTKLGVVGVAKQIHLTILGSVLLAPFDVFARAITAPSPFPELARWGGIAVGINLMMLGVVMGLDANYLETASSVSQRRFDRMRRMRRGGIGSAGNQTTARFRIVRLPWLGGAGPVAWRQLTGAVRGSRRLLILVAIVGVVGVSVVLHDRGEHSSVLEPLIGVAVWINLFFVSTLKFDFHDDLDRLDLLRSLPIRPAAVAVGEIAAPVIVLGMLQAVLLIGAGVAAPESRPYLAAAAAFALPFNVLLVGVENLLFLMFPLRQAGLIAGDMQLFGRQMVVFLCKAFILLVALVVASAIGAIAFAISHLSWVAAGIAGWIALALISAGTIPLMATVYSRFDPSMDTPP